MSPILDISGAYCPMGCGQTLHLMSGGLISCLAPECPNKGAVQLILSDPEVNDVVVFGEERLVVVHPLRERLGDLMSCQVLAICMALDGPPDGIPGRYRAIITNGDLHLERLGQ